ncbi:MarR family winged helix-turn-helix transcriptional regulator [Companilactobacillus jidongensis]|uniref:MarR family winged helix-turn-helix transcriptional regulator n=1 Tax=Companilactobacillus jidongensis TaxID=2486006 RepID=UPI0013DE283B|nr:MarR family winged helix-turn-helix transcriptional regulator [Companilactobacillus jidongensis]
MFQIRGVSLKIDRYVKSQYPLFDHDAGHISKLQGMSAGYIAMNDGEEIFQRDLEHAMSISKSTASGLVKRMVKNGIIETSPSSRDARYKRLMLTQQAREKMQQVSAAATEAENSLRADISDEDMNKFFEVLNKISNNAE